MGWSWTTERDVELGWRSFHDRDGWHFTVDSDGYVGLDLSDRELFLALSAPWPQGSAKSRAFWEFLRGIIVNLDDFRVAQEAEFGNWIKEVEAFVEAPEMAPHGMVMQTIEKLNSMRYNAFAHDWAEKHLNLLVQAGLAWKRGNQYRHYNEDSLAHCRDRPGWVYLLKGAAWHKIGRALDISMRLTKIAPKLPFEVVLIGAIETNDMINLEYTLHQKFASKRDNGEWFKLDTYDIEWLKSLDGWQRACDICGMAE